MTIGSLLYSFEIHRTIEYIIWHCESNGEGSRCTSFGHILNEVWLIMPLTPRLLQQRQTLCSGFALKFLFTAENILLKCARVEPVCGLFFVVYCPLLTKQLHYTSLHVVYMFIITYHNSQQVHAILQIFARWNDNSTIVAPVYKVNDHSWTDMSFRRMIRLTQSLPHHVFYYSLPKDQTTTTTKNIYP